jgi:hypothetical protein
MAVMKGVSSVHSMEGVVLKITSFWLYLGMIPNLVICKKYIKPLYLSREEERLREVRGRKAFWMGSREWGEGIKWRNISIKKKCGLIFVPWIMV